MGTFALNIFPEVLLLCIFISSGICSKVPKDTSKTKNDSNVNQDPYTNIEECALEMDGESQSHLMLTAASTAFNITLTGPPGRDVCILRLLIVGGGGRASDAGAGSGYYKCETFLLEAGNTKISASVGGPREETDVSIKGDISSIYYQASPGGDGDRTSGGDGYSGGGDAMITEPTNHPDEGYSGGSDGGDGEGAATWHGQGGGKGTGEDINDCDIFNSFTVTSGSGGQPKYYNPYDDDAFYYGGGGGGVIVKDAWNPGESIRSFGYGAGGGSGWGYEDGFAGLILLEVEAA